MKGAIIGIGLMIVAAVCILLYPYSCLVNLKDIAEELKEIRKFIEDKKVTEDSVYRVSHK